MAINYTVKNGDTLNSISQAHGFNNYKSAGVTSVPSGNFDLIRPGEVITMGDQPKDVQNTTTGLRIQTKKNSAEYDKMMADQEKNRQMAEQAKNNAPPTPVVEPPKDPNAPTLTWAQEQEKKLKDFETSQINDAVNTYNGLRSSMDSTTNQMIDAITTQYGGMIKDMEDSNKRLEAAKGQIGIRSGRERYMGNIQSGILTDEHQQGIGRIEKLKGAMLGAIASAQSARDQNKAKLFNDQFSQIKSIQESIKNEIKTNYDYVLKWQEQDRLQKTADARATAEATDAMYKKSEESAPGLVKAMAGFDTPEEKKALLENYAAKTGIDMVVLLGDIEKAGAIQEKDRLAIENIKSQISNRGTKNTQIPSGTGDTEIFTEEDFSSIDADVKKYGLEKTIAGLSQEQANLIRERYQGSNKNLSIGQTPGLNWGPNADPALNNAYLSAPQNKITPTPSKIKVNLTGFTSTEKKKLEQAGLLNKDRQTQLDYLYGKKPTSSSTRGGA